MINASWTPKATNIIAEYVILIAFQPQQWLREVLQWYEIRTVHWLSFDK